MEHVTVTLHATPIYQHGKWRVVPLAISFAVQGPDGRTVQKFGANEIERAVSLVDDLAFGDGATGHVAA